MSTKTTLKRLALVTAVALGLGGVSTVSAHAAVAEQTVTSIAAGTLIARPTVATTSTLTFTGAFSASGDTFTVGAKITSAPTLSSAATVAFSSATFAGATTKYGAVSGAAAAGTSSYATVTQGTSTTTAKAKLTFTPDVAGTYQILVWTGGNAYAAGYTTTAINVTTAGAPTTASLTTWGTTSAVVAATGDNASGTLVKLTLKDANGAATVPTANESIDISVSGAASAATVSIGGTAQSTGSKKSYTNSDFASGSKYFNVNNTAAENYTISVSGSGLLSGNGLAASVGLKSVALDSTSETSASVVIPDATVATAANTGGFSATSGTTATSLTTQPLTFSLPVAVTSTLAGGYVGYQVVDTTGAITGSTGGTYWGVVATTAADKLESISISANLGTSADNKYVVTSLVGTSASAASAGALTVTGGTSTATTLAAITPAVVLSAAGATNTFTTKVTDNFGAALPNIPVTVAISGRNAATTISGNLVTNASGYVTFSYTDAGTASSTVTQDTVTFTATGIGSTKSAVVNFGTATAATVTVTGGNTADVAPAKTYTSISTGSIGTTAGAVAFTATVKDVNGNLLAGVPVTFSVDSGLIVKSASTDYSVVYTGAAGTATTYAFAWLTGKQTVTAKAGAVSGTGYANWRDDVASQARTISAVTDATLGNVINITVTDRFGNGVKGANITLSRVGTGFFFGGASTSTATTGSDGTVSVQFTGSGTVTATLDTTTEGYDIAGQVQATALTAAVAGTTTGTGATLSAAGVGSSSVTITAGSDASTVAAQAAVDAANEATDAANAATDAANNAMDSADAAQQAALDAGDKADAALAAVTDLATKVSAIASQIASLSALVKKIAAKVKA